MSETWVRPIARIRGGTSVIGTGMLAPGSVVLTCAHVIGTALGRGGTAGPGAKVTLDLPFAGLFGISATVAKDGWFPEVQRGVGSPRDDLAVLELADPEVLATLEGCLVAEADPAPGLLFSAVGFPSGYPESAPSQGELRGYDAGGRLDAVADSAFGHFVDPGFSGAPVFERRGAAVVGGTALGLCVTNDPAKRVARIIPPSDLARVLRAVISPYRWLAAFGARDTAFYFGREALTDALWQDLQDRERRFLLLAGAAGSGKSSVLRAGLANRAAAAGYAVQIFRPLVDAKAELAAAFGLPREAKIEAVADAIRRAADRQQVLLGMDQAEELVRGPLAHQARDLLQMFAELREDLNSRLLLVLSARGDALDALFSVQPRPGGPTRPGLLERHLRFLDPLGREELLNAITRPAARLRVRFGRGLAERIVEDVLRHQVPLPLSAVQLCLSWLWQSRMDDEIPVSAYDAMGGVTGALTRHASGVLAEIGHKAKAMADSRSGPGEGGVPAIAERLVAHARGILVALVQIGASSGEDRRRRVPIDELPRLHAGSTEGSIAEAAERIAREELEAGRLVVTGRLADGTEVLELAHDSLLTEWHELRDWVEDDRLFQRWHNRLREHVRETPEDLLSEAQLLEADRVLQREAEREGEMGRTDLGPAPGSGRSAEPGIVRLDPRVSEFIARSRAAQRERVEALQAERDAASRVGSLLLTERSRQATQNDPMTGMLLALAALPNTGGATERPWVQEASVALQEALSLNREQLCLARHTNWVACAAFCPDGTRVVTASSDNTARVWDAVTGDQLAMCSGHSDWIRHAAFNPQGTRIVTASKDNTARVWNTANGEPIAQCIGHSDYVLYAAFSLDGMHIVTASRDNTARVWCAVCGKRVAVCRGHMGSVLHAAFSTDGTSVVTASSDNTARVWDPATGTQLAEYHGHAGSVSYAAFNLEGTRIVTASSDNTAHVWETRTGKRIAVGNGHSNAVLHAVFSPDGARIVTASRDKTARVWDAGTGTQLAQCNGHGDSVLQAAFSADGARIVTASSDKTARVWRAASGAQIARFDGHGDAVLQAAFSPESARVVTASADSTARVWTVDPGNQLARFDGHSRAVLRAAFSADGTRIVTASKDNTARVWCAATGKQIAECIGHVGSVLQFSPDGAQIITGSVLHAAFSPDGTRIVTGGDDNTARIWDAYSGRLDALCVGHDGPVVHAAFSPDGKRIVTASGDKTARVWDAHDGREGAVFKGHDNWVWNATFSPDGKRVVTASGDKTARVWDADDGRERVLYKGHDKSVLHATFSPNGKRIVTASDDNTARAWDADSGEHLTLCQGHSKSVRNAEFSPNGRRIVTASLDGTARVWDAASGDLLALCRGHADYVAHAAFSPDENGARIVTASLDSTARVWDSATGDQLAVYGGHGGSVAHAAFSPDGARVVTASSDSTARIFCVFRDGAELVEFAKTRVTRGLTPAQRIHNYLEPRDPARAEDHTIPPTPYCRDIRP